MSASRDRLQQESAKKIGTVLDSKYRLDALLGFGAAGAVFRATNTWSGREFAVKVLHGDGEGEEATLHRDLKPENIFLADTPEGVDPKVLDFGIAQLADSRVTRSIDIMGTPSYMAPEAFVQAKEVDARADVWGLGVMLYEIVSGRVPFGEDATTLVAVLYQIASQDPASLLDQGLLGPSTWAVVRRCLEREPARRYADARALQAALTDVLPTL